MTATTLDLPRFNPGNPELIRDPYPNYAHYRQVDPVHWGIATMADLPGSWYLFRYAENAAVLSDATLFANDPASVGMQGHVPGAFQPVAHIFQRWLGGMDAPDHRRLRTILAKAFTPRRVAALEPRIVGITKLLIEDALTKSDGRIDVIADVSFPLPMAVVGDALGVRPDDWRLFQAWAADISNAVDQAGDPQAGAAGAAAIQSMFEYFSEAVRERRSKPTDDLLSAMVAAADDAGAPMQEFDAIAIATELGVAGHETTTNAVAKSIIGLMEQRDRWDELKGAAGPHLDSAIDELLRWTAPVQRQRWRWVTEQTVLGDRVVERGASVVSILAAANRDPIEFPDPDRIQFDRASGRHLTFGFGTHFCLGSTLAKLEMRVALEQLAAAVPSMQLIDEVDDIRWRNNSIIPGPAELWVKG
jgi:cytochrome P450